MFNMSDTLENLNKLVSLLIVLIPIIFGFAVWLHANYKKLSGLLSKFEQIESALSELKPNHGTSIKDAINRIEDKISSLTFSQRIYWDIAIDIPMFMTDTYGKCIWANKSYLKLIGRPSEEILGTGWELAIHQEDRDKIRDEFYRACKEHRHFDMTFRYYSTENETINVRCRAYGNTRTGYVGFITQV